MVEKRNETAKPAAQEQESVMRQEWRRPECRRLDASDAETGFNTGGDFGFS
jgi:hypothetical protein